MVQEFWEGAPFFWAQRGRNGAFPTPSWCPKVLAGSLSLLIKLLPSKLS